MTTTYASKITKPNKSTRNGLLMAASIAIKSISVAENSSKKMTLNKLIESSVKDFKLRTANAQNESTVNTTSMTQL